MGRKSIEMVRKSELDKALIKIKELNQQFEYNKMDLAEAHNQIDRMHIRVSHYETTINNLHSAISILGQACSNKDEENLHLRVTREDAFNQARNNSNISSSSMKIEDNIFEEPSLSSRKKSVSVTRKTKQPKTKRKYKRRKK